MAERTRTIRIPHRRGFTLVELLVVISIIALLISILLPSLKRARDSAKAVACGAQQRGFGTGLNVYATEESEWIPGRNTSGMAIWVAGARGDGSAMSQSHLPVQTYDWLTPILSKTTQLPASRPARFRTLFGDYACTAVNFKATPYIQSSPPRDEARFVADVEAHGAFPATSYLMPVHFQFWGHAEPETVVGFYPIDAPLIPFRVGRSPRPGTSAEWEVRVLRYKSRTNQVGTPAEKIAVADGTRYLPWRGFLDFDYHQDPEWFGAFTSAGGWWRGSIAYGDDRRFNANQSGGKNLPLSFRHQDGIAALFFDGHVERLSRTQARKIDYWYPRGGKVVKAVEGYTDYDTYNNGYLIR